MREVDKVRGFPTYTQAIPGRISSEALGINITSRRALE